MLSPFCKDAMRVDVWDLTIIQPQKHGKPNILENIYYRPVVVLIPSFSVSVEKGYFSSFQI